MREGRPYGSWRSPLSAALVAQAGVRLMEPWAGADGSAWWLEGRPAEGGRVAVVRRGPGERPRDVIPAAFSARTRVHEYGGGAYAVHDETLFFSNDSDGRLYRLDPGGEPRPITPEPPAPRALRYADMRAMPDGATLICVRETHRDHSEPVNELVALPADGSHRPQVIASGRDFYSSPRPSPDGRRLAWTSWDHPLMPWNGSELWLADLGPDGSLGEPELVAGGPAESIFQPEWSPDGALHFASDRSGWWNLYRVEDGEASPLYPMEADFGLPQWAFGMATYAFARDGRIACAYAVAGEWRLALLDPSSGRLDDLRPPCAPGRFAPLRAAGGRLVFVRGSPALPPAVVSLDVDTGDLEVLSEPAGEPTDPAYVSTARPIEFRTADGSFAHALFYPPRNPEERAPDGERPPLVVQAHGGPTGQATSELELEVQFWTTRGFAFCDVNYGGSTGYGRAYRERLHGEWGVVDVEDCVAAARHLAESGAVDGARMLIRGGSAGGYTTLCALALHDVFAAGTSYYGVADLESFARQTHKFEAHYDEWLVPPQLRAERSPVHAADRIRAPLLVLQGLEDAIVPPAQAEAIVAALERNGVPHEYIAFEGEQHGFRRAETIERALTAELAFYAEALGLPAPPA